MCRLAEAWEMAVDGRITDVKTISGIFGSKHGLSETDRTLKRSVVLPELWPSAVFAVGQKA